MSDIRHPESDSPSPEHPEAQALNGRTPWGTLGGRVVSIVSRKGGVGKTTSAVNLGAALNLCGHTVLIVGMDPQCGVCRSLGMSPDEMPVSLTDLFDHGERLADLVQQSPLDGLHFVSPRVLTLEDEERFGATIDRRAGEFVREIDRARSLYDTVLIDCAPGLGAGTRAALMASDGYLVPVQAEELCRDSLPSLLDFVDEFRARNFLRPDDTKAEESVRRAEAPLALEGLFLTMVNERTRMGRHVAARMDEDYGEVLFNCAVPRTTRLSEMALRGKPAVIYDRRSVGSRAYFDLADELVERYCRNREAEETVTYPLSEADLATVTEREEIAESLAPAHGSALSGVDRFLSELIGQVGAETGDGPAPTREVAEPEMVSLDELLAEEESPSSGDDSWDEGHWNRDAEPGDRVN
ncbi:MAG: ParA family protein [bacterium]|nr:ParA family protein [bacterium]